VKTNYFRGSKLKEFSEKTKEKLRFTLLPEEHWYAVVSKVQDSSNPDLIQSWLEDPTEHLESSSKGLYIYGQYRRGKSSLAALIMKLSLARGIYGLWLNYRDLPGYVINKDLFTDNQTILERAKEVELLVIDEFYPEVRTGFFPVKTLDDLIRDRLQKNKTTIITSNCSPNDLIKGKLKDLTSSLVFVLGDACSSVELKGDVLKK
jgi:primosomal protein DnaI